MITTNIKVGDGASTGYNGDSYPYTVVKVFSPRKIAVTRDSYKVIEKNACYKEGALECEFTTNWDAPQTILTKRKNGRWIPVGESLSGWGFYIGERIYSRNPHF